MTELSILITAIFSRYEKAEQLLKLLHTQSEGKNVSINLFLDNKKISIGEKRQILLDNSKSKYICFIDDDDFVSDDFIDEILSAIKEGCDVITFNQMATIDSDIYEVSFGLKNENEQLHSNGIVRRKPFHVCVWKYDLIKDCKFTHINYGEDWDFAKLCNDKAKTETHINKTLHFYNFSSKLTEAK